MGWTFPYHTDSKQDLIRDLTMPQDCPERDTVFRTLKQCVRGNVLWTLHESGKVGETRKWIGCYLLAKHGGDTWGYKDMDESMGPCYYNCPISYLDAADEPQEGGYAVEWRAKVRALATEKSSRKPKVGEFWKLSNGQTHKILSVKPLRGSYQYGIYRIPRRMLREVVL
jgi:hypothetical protein